MAKFQAFISYRHCDPDRRIAKWLLNSLETFRIPKRLASAEYPTQRIGKCFRDEDELPASSDLNEQIRQNLEASRFLVVVSSPRTPESRWIGREIELFQAMGRRSHIILLLIEGEPSDSFHPQIFVRDGQRATPGSTQPLDLTAEEPHSADLRHKPGESKAAIKRNAILRIIAPIIGCGFDELKKRDAHRRKVRARWIATGVLVLLLAAAWAGSRCTIIDECGLDNVDRACREECSNSTTTTTSVIFEVYITNHHR
jgi:hypothetical protein